MEPNRIKVNGFWYVKEETEETKPIELDTTFTECCIVETDLYCYEASRLKRVDDTFYDDISIEVTSKIKGDRKNWIKDYWDHQLWLLGILDNNPESMPEFIKAIPEKNEQEIFIAMLKKLVEIGWLNKSR